MSKISEDRKFHGSPWDRGEMDSYYRRGCLPHWRRNGSPLERVEKEDMTEQEIAEYYAGFEYNEEMGDNKDYG